jgi:hypothetical protein
MNKMGRFLRHLKQSQPVLYQIIKHSAVASYFKSDKALSPAFVLNI